MNKNKTRKIFLEELPRRGKLIDWKNSIGYKIKFIYEDIKDEFEIIEYDKKYQKLKIKYNDNEYYILIGNLKKCKLGNILNKHTYNFKIEIGQTFKDNKRDMIIIDRKYKRKEQKDGKIENKKLYKYHCNKCGFDCGKHYSLKDKQYKDELWIREDHLLHGVGCSCCGKGNQITIKGINDIATTHPWMIKYFVNVEDCYKYRYSSEEIVLCKCPQCGYEKEMDIFNLYKNGFSCSQCCDGISYPEKFMFNLLKQLNIEFETEYSPDWIKPKRYDFYIPSKNLIIEMDGAFHKNDNSMSNQTKEQSKDIDNYKDKLAEEHGLKVIRIDCNYGNVIKRFKYIKKNIIKELHNIFNLNDINWINIDGLCQKSLVKEVCDFWKIHNNINNENITTSEISKIFKIDISIIVSYLKKGTELDWCIYNPKEEMIKNGIRNGKRKSKAIKVFNDFISYTFNSYTELEKLSVKILGVKLSSKNFSYYIKNKKPYKGFYLKNI